MNILLRPPRKLTVDEFYDFVHRPENDARWFELVQGEVIELPPPTRIHGLICGNVSFALNTYVRKQRKGYIVTNDSGVVLQRNPDTVRGPDVAYFEDVNRSENLPEKWGDTQPRLVVEVLSPSDRADHVNRKIVDYLENNVEIVWVVDPETRTVTVYRTDAGPEMLTENEKLSGGAVLPGFRCKVADFFHMHDPPAEKKPRAKRKGET